LSLLFGAGGRELQRLVTTELAAPELPTPLALPASPAAIAGSEPPLLALLALPVLADRTTLALPGAPLLGGS
jgi:hypothetical protein